MVFACNFSTLISHELSYARQSATARKLRISLSTCCLSRNSKGNLLIRAQIRAIKSDPAASDQVRHNKLINGENSQEMDGCGSTNDNRSAKNSITSGTGSRCGGNELAGSLLNEDAGSVVSKHSESSRSLVEHVIDDNPVEFVQEVQPLKMESEAIAMEEMKRKKKNKVQDIGQEETRFKKTWEDKDKFSAAPGGRWSRFESYSTIERTLEIWGHVLAFVFKAWLNNQKFSYLGSPSFEIEIPVEQFLVFRLPSFEHCCHDCRFT